MQTVVMDSFVFHFPRAGVANYVFYCLTELAQRGEFDLTALTESNGFADPEIAAFVARALKVRLVQPDSEPMAIDPADEPLAERLPSPHEVARAIAPGEIYHATDWFHYPASRAKLNVLTYHDLTAQIYPETHEHTNLVKENRKLRAARDFDHVVADSHATRRDLIEYGDLDPSRISVAHLGAGAAYDRAGYFNRAEFLRRYRLAEDTRYVLSVSTIERRKNIVGILTAFGLAKDNSSLRHLKLILSGRMGWKNEELRQFLDDFRYRDDVIFIGYVPLADMPSLYRHAEAFMYLSFYEGFGLPILEAMKSRCPVICSDVSSMPEVIGDCGEQASPTRPDQAAAALVRIVEDPLYADRLRFAALARSKQFTWARHVDHLTAIYNRA